MIFGVGCDIVAVQRFAITLENTPQLRARLFTPAEQTLSVRSLAARFAAKEAAIKAFGGSAITGQTGQKYDLTWQDIEILQTAGKRPEFSKTVGLQTALELAGVAQLHLSLSHDGDYAQAYVVAERA